MHAASSTGDSGRHVPISKATVYRYLGQGSPDSAASPEAFARMAVELNAVLLPLLANRPGPGRRRRLLSTVVVPADDMPESADGRREQ